MGILGLPEATVGDKIKVTSLRGDLGERWISWRKGHRSLYFSKANILAGR